MVQTHCSLTMQRIVFRGWAYSVLNEDYFKINDLEHGCFYSRVPLSLILISDSRMVLILSLTVTDPRVLQRDVLSLGLCGFPQQPLLWLQHDRRVAYHGERDVQESLLGHLPGRGASWRPAGHSLYSDRSHQSETANPAGCIQWNWEK